MTASEELEAAEKLLRTLEELDVPDNVKTAAKAKWEATADARIEAAANIAYPKTKQAEDRQRAVRLEDVITLLQNLEEEQIDEAVTGPIEVVADALVSSYKLYFDLASGSAKIIKALIQSPEDLSNVLLEIVKNFLVIASAVEIAKRLRAILKLRDDYAEQLRELTLPQRIVTRHRVKKRTREH
jgi:SepF-like predicted cell division protein (DUF552 family)